MQQGAYQIIKNVYLISQPQRHTYMNKRETTVTAAQDVQQFQQRRQHYSYSIAGYCLQAVERRTARIDYSQRLLSNTSCSHIGVNKRRLVQERKVGWEGV